MDNLSSLVDNTEFAGMQISKEIKRDQKSEFGQFLTSSSIAKIIANQFGAISGDVKLLDAGAGVGMLTSAFVERVLLNPVSVNSFQVTAYEIEPKFVPVLKQTLSECCSALEQAGIKAHYRLLGDFLVEGSQHLSSPLLVTPPNLFTHSILNPPYKKINSKSIVRRTLLRAGINTVNYYTAFVWLATLLLESKGEITAITPRSFCNGTYYLPFRQYFLKEVALDRIHIFDSRSAVFSGDDVLQENVIFHGIKNIVKSKYVTITSSSGFREDRIPSKEKQTPYISVVKPDDPGQFIHITTDDSDDILHEQMKLFPSTLTNLGLRVSTGPIVDFRVKNQLSQTQDINTVPLIYPEAIKFGKVIWPPVNSRKPITIYSNIETKKWLVPCGWYVLTKRFSAKEEKRRVIAAACPPFNYSEIGLENHINYFHENGKGMDENLAKGLTMFLNSTLFDKYFRQFSGHTQVNATDLRAMRYPLKNDLISLGSKVRDEQLSQKEIDRIVQEVIVFTDETKKSFNAYSRIQDALEILMAISVPREQQNERSALCLLALGDIKNDTNWDEIKQPLRRITEMMDWFRAEYSKNYAPNTRETVRRQTMHQFIQLGIVVENPDKHDRPINSPYWCYQLTDSAVRLLRSFGSPTWDEELSFFRRTSNNVLREKHHNLPTIPVTLNDGREFNLSAGGQNELIKNIIEEFCPRFTPGGIVLYVGDAGKKFVVKETDLLSDLGVDIDPHGKMPDLIIYHKQKDWLILIEAVTSHGPVDLKRHNELKDLFRSSKKGLVFVTAFPSRKLMVGYLEHISWETEVWVADYPDHLIHFNGERFLGPYDS